MGSSITLKQARQLERLAGDAILGVVSDKDTAEQLIENDGELQAKIKEVIRSLIGNRYANEEESSTYTYPPQYKLKSPEEQVEILRKLFPDLSAYYSQVANQPLPEGAEGWFLIPRWSLVAHTYNGALAKVLDLLGKSRHFHNYREGTLGPNRLKQSERTAAFFAQIEQQQTGDFLVVAAQFGLRHRGRSVRRAREVFLPNEFGLGAFAVVCMALSHPERFFKWDELNVDCAGDEYSFPGGDFSSSPIFLFDDPLQEFDSSWIDLDPSLDFDARLIDFANPFFGSVSGFALQ